MTVLVNDVFEPVTDLSEKFLERVEQKNKQTNLE